MLLVIPTFANSSVPTESDKDALRDCYKMAIEKAISMNASSLVGSLKVHS